MVKSGSRVFRSSVSVSSVAFYAAFLATGVATVLTSSLLPLLEVGADPRGASGSLVGRMLAVQFAGQLAGALALRRGANRMLLLGAAITAIAAWLLSRHLFGHPVELFAFGFGLGLSMSAVNAIVAQESTAEERTRKLELLNVFWPLGAALSPWIVIHASLGQRPGLPFAVLGVVFAMLMLYAALRTSAPEPDEEEGERLSESPRRLIQIALLGFLAVGVETAAANWLPTLDLEHAATAGLIPDATLFWLGTLVSRVAASRWLHKSGNDRFVQLCSAVACLALLGVASLRSSAMLSACSVVAAFALGPVYPVLISVGLRLRWKGMIFFSSGLGSVLVPWIVGRVATSTNSLHTGMMAAVLGCVLLALGSGRLSAPADPALASGE